MKHWKKYAAMNAGALIGIGLATFVRLASIPFWFSVVIAVVFLAVFNYFLHRRLQKPIAVEPKGDRVSIIIGVIGTIIFLLDMAYQYFHR